MCATIIFLADRPSFLPIGIPCIAIIRARGRYRRWGWHDRRWWWNYWCWWWHHRLDNRHYWCRSRRASDVMM